MKDTVSTTRILVSFCWLEEMGRMRQECREVTPEEGELGVTGPEVRVMPACIILCGFDAVLCLLSVSVQMFNTVLYIVVLRSMYGV